MKWNKTLIIIALAVGLGQSCENGRRGPRTPSDETHSEGSQQSAGIQQPPVDREPKEDKDLAARMKITGRDVYQMERSFDVMQAVAKTEGGGMMNIGIGLGAGNGVGAQVGGLFVNTMNTNLTTPPSMTTLPVSFFIYL